MSDLRHGPMPPPPRPIASPGLSGGGLTAAQQARQQHRHASGAHGGQYATMQRAEADLGVGGVDLLGSDPVDSYGDPVNAVVDDLFDDGESVVDHGPVEARTDYTFESWKVPYAVASAEKANRRAERAGIPERFGYTVETFDVTRPNADDPDGPDEVVEMATFTLDRPKVCHDGWEFVSTLTWDDEAGMISRNAPGATLDERPDERMCDVCGTARDRRDTFVVQKTDEATGERIQMQVGSNCLQRFFGIKPSGLFMLEFDVDESEDRTPPDTGRNRVEKRYPMADVLAMAIAVTKKHGWTSRSAAQAYAEASGGEAHKQATADHVAFGLWAEVPEKAWKEKAEQAELRALAAQITADEVADLLAEARSLEGDSDYAYNVRAIASGETVTARNFSTLISVIGARQNRLEREARQAAEAKANGASKHVGVIGERTDFAVEVESTRFIDNDYNGKTLVTMRDAEGNLIKWWAAGDQTHLNGKYEMKATIKEHGEYRGALETTVQRAKMVAIDD